MTCKVTVQKNTFAESLAIVGRAVGSHTHLPILSNILLSKDEGQLRLSATDLTLGVTVWMDANMDGDPVVTHVLELVIRIRLALIPHCTSQGERCDWRDHAIVQARRQALA